MIGLKLQQIVLCPLWINAFLSRNTKEFCHDH